MIVSPRSVFMGHGPCDSRGWVRLFDTLTRRGLSLIYVATMISSSSQQSTESLISRMTPDGACRLRAVWHNSRVVYHTPHVEIPPGIHLPRLSCTWALFDIV